MQPSAIHWASTCCRTGSNCWRISRTYVQQQSILLKYHHIHHELALPGSVETQLGWSDNFCSLFCRVFIPVSSGIKKYKNDQENWSYNQKQNGTLFMAHGVHWWLCPEAHTVSVIKATYLPFCIMKCNLNSTIDNNEWRVLSAKMLLSLVIRLWVGTMSTGGGLSHR